MHYRRLKNSGTLDAGKRSPATLAERFWRQVEKKDNDSCWPWIGSKNVKGYGNIGQGGKGGNFLLAHRVSYMLNKGEIPNGLFVMHMCDNPNCVNPAHLMLGTPKENTQDALRKNRLKTVFKNGEQNKMSKLTDEQAKYIKNHPEERGVDLAKLFNVSPQTICGIRKGRRWSTN
jgi:hypothetical protein